MIIDTFVKIDEKSCGKCPDLEILMQHMDENGIAKAVISSYPHRIDNARILDCVNVHKDRFIAFYMADPWKDDQASITQAVCDGFRGLVLDPVAHGFVMNDTALLDPLLSVCERHHMCVWLNTFSSFFSSCTLAEELAKTYPHAVFLLGHMGFNYDASCACEIAERYENVYLETSGSMSNNLIRAKKTCGARKILMGSGFPDINYPYLAIRNLADVFEGADLDDVLGNNFEMLMKKVIV